MIRSRPKPKPAKPGRTEQVNLRLSEREIEIVDGSRDQDETRQDWIRALIRRQIASRPRGA